MGTAENIKKRRLELGLSQQDLAKIMGYKSRSTINKIESGENLVSNVKLVHFAKALDTTVDFLKTGKSASNTAREYITRKGGKTAVMVLAGGKSTRNLQNIPNQFINVLGKPIIMYVLEAYQNHPAIDDIYVVCLKGWENIVDAYSKQYGITKLVGIIPAGETGILSVRKGVEFISERYDSSDTVILQESTRPLITQEIISKLLHCASNTIICEHMDDYMQVLVDGDETEYLDRNKILAIQSPEKYSISSLIEMFEAADKIGHRYDESTCGELMHKLNFPVYLCEGNHNNIKVVRQEDIAILSALLKNKI